MDSTSDATTKLGTFFGGWKTLRFEDLPGTLTEAANHEAEYPGCWHHTNPFIHILFKEINAFTQILTSFPGLKLNLTTQLENVTADSKILMEEFEYQSRNRFTCYQTNSCRVDYSLIVPIIALFGALILASASFLWYYFKIRKCLPDIFRRLCLMLTLSLILLPTSYFLVYFASLSNLCRDADKFFQEKLLHF